MLSLKSLKVLEIIGVIGFFVSLVIINNVGNDYFVLQVLAIPFFAWMGIGFGEFYRTMYIADITRENNN